MKLDIVDNILQRRKCNLEFRYSREVYDMFFFYGFHRKHQVTPAILRDI